MGDNMENISDEKKIESLINYYKDNGLLIVGLNDSQGVNTTSTFFKKGLLEYLQATLTSKDLTPEIINAFSLTMNKTEHIDYFLQQDLSVEEIKLSQIYSAVSALKKVMQDIGLPIFLGNVGNLSRLVYRIHKEDKNIKLSTSLQGVSEPVMIYSSGVNNLMREVGSNPFAIKKDYQNREEKPNYYYTLEKAEDPKTLTKVMDGIERNYEHILGINPKTDIYALGAYVPKSLQCEEMNVFRNLVITYNEKLLELCNQYGVVFVDTEKVGKEYNKSENNFHISSSGHNALANCILGHMYQSKIMGEKTSKGKEIPPYEIIGSGAIGVHSSLFEDIYDCYSRKEEIAAIDDYSYEREVAIESEHIREAKIFGKVLSKQIKRIDS